MKAWRCSVCGYVHYGDSPPDSCPQCGAPKEKFVLQEENAAPEGGAGARESGTGAGAARPDTGKVSVAESGGRVTPAAFSAAADSMAAITAAAAMAATETAADVVVVGAGAAGFAAAITARNEGCSVIMLEKAASIGGTTILSGGGFWTPNNRFQRARGTGDSREAALRYMARYSYPHLFRPDGERCGVPENEFQLLEAIVDHAAEMTEYLEGIGALKLAEEINWTGRPQVDYQDHLPENNSIRGRVLYTQDEKGNLGFGFVLVNYLNVWAEAHGVRILVNHEATRIRRDDRGRVIGVEARSGDRTSSYTAHKGVIFGTGGFSHNPEMMLHFSRGPIFGGCSAPSNTGDFVRMAGEIGARLGNMGGAFRAQSVLEGVLSNPGGFNNVFFVPGDSVIEVNRIGQRVMNEKRNYTDRGMVHFVWDPNRAEWTNMLLFLVYDSRTADLWQGMPPYPMPGTEAPYVITADNLPGLAAAIGERLGALKDHTGGFSLDDRFTENLVQTVARFNQFAAAGKDEDFQRGDFAYDREWTTFPPLKPNAGKWPEDMARNYTMFPFSETGPYHAIILASSTLDTNGGPVTNRNGQVLDVRGEVIEGLYGAGNCIASPTANAYWGAGSTIGPAMTFGYLAARHAARK